jgi:taurine dioxygenase
VNICYQKIKVEAAVSGFGAALRGMDLSQPLPAVVLAEVKQAWAEHSVVWFPDQPLTHEELEAFTAQMGEFGFDPYIEAMPDHPHILELRRQADEKAQNFGAAWHSDWSFQKAPPSATILHAKVVPPEGGDTLYADCYRAYEALSATMQAMLAGLNCIHSAALAYSPKGILAAEPNERTMQINFSEDAEKTELHPLVRVHPVSGRKALYVNPVYTQAIDGMTAEESFVLLSWLYEHVHKDEFVYRHHWRENMLTMWDNRCCNHFADGGYDGHLRVMHRTTVAGEVPQGAGLA